MKAGLLARPLNPHPTKYTTLRSHLKVWNHKIHTSQNVTVKNHIETSIIRFKNRYKAVSPPSSLQRSTWMDIMKDGNRSLQLAEFYRVRRKTDPGYLQDTKLL